MVRQLLNSSDVDPNVLGDKGSTALLVAVSKNMTDVVSALLEGNSSVDVNLANEEGLFPLFVAAHKGYNDILKILLARYANA